MLDYEVITIKNPSELSGDELILYLHDYLKERNIKCNSDTAAAMLTLLEMGSTVKAVVHHGLFNSEIVHASSSVGMPTYEPIDDMNERIMAIMKNRNIYSIDEIIKLFNEEIEFTELNDRNKELYLCIVGLVDFIDNKNDSNK